jgi:hypothetical protein
MHNHRQLEALLAQLVAACDAGASEEVTRLWQTFEFGLLRYLKQEETLFFSTLRILDQNEVRRLTDEHLQIRKRLFELGLCIDLHLVRADALREFAELLKQTAHGRMRCYMPVATGAGSASCS